MDEYVRNPRYCLQCDDGTILEYGAKDVCRDIYGEVYEVHAVKGWHCPKCGEIEFADGEGKRYGVALEAAYEAYEKRRAAEPRAS